MRSEVIKELLRRTPVAGVLFLLLAAGLFATQPAEASGPQSYEPGQVVVKLSANTSIASVNVTYGTSTLNSLLGNIYLLKLPAGTSVEQAIQKMSADPTFSFVEPNYFHETPEDASTDRTYAWGGKDGSLGAREDYSRAHTVSRGYGVIVAILDTGTQMNHPELRGSIDILAYDFVDNDPFPWDDPNGKDDDGDGLVDEAVGHGTHVAGVIHQIAPDALLMPLRVLNSDGRGNNFRTAKAMLYAAAGGAEVLNMSLGTIEESRLMREVLSEIAHQGVVVVAAAGNLNNQGKQYPAADACALAVTSVSAKDKKSDFANYGDWVDIAAVGENIYSTVPVDGYAWWSGTSMATPYITGQVVLLRSVNYRLTLAQLGSLLGASASSLENNNPHYRGMLGAGKSNIAQSLELLSSGTMPGAEHNLFAGCN